VDDFISEAKSKEEAVTIMDQASKLLAKGKFKLRKWCSNVSAVLDEVAILKSCILRKGFKKRNGSVFA